MPTSANETNARNLVAKYQDFASQAGKFAETVSHRLYKLFSDSIVENDDGTTSINVTEDNVKAAIDDIKDIVNQKYLKIPSDLSADTEEGTLELQRAYELIADRYVNFEALGRLFSRFTPEAISDYAHQTLAQNFGRNATENALYSVPEAEREAVLESLRAYIRDLERANAEQTVKDTAAAKTLEGILSGNRG